MNEYLARIDAERKVLKQVNRAFPKPELTGLSLIALKSWREKQSSLKFEQFEILEELSSAVGLLCERSGGHLNQTEKLHSEKVAMLIQKFARSLQ